MVTQCTESSLQTVITKFSNKEVFRIKIEKNEDQLFIDYDTKADCSDDKKKKEISDMLNDCTGLIIKVVNDLIKLKDILSIGESPTEYKMLFDCYNDRAGRPDYSISFVIPNVILNKLDSLKEDKEEEIIIDWNKVFKDKLDVKVPGLFSKKSSKKYMQVTYRDLANILSEN